MFYDIYLLTFLMVRFHLLIILLKNLLYLGMYIAMIQHSNP